MSSNINRVNISGNLTRDPELRGAASGTQILSFGVAVNDRRKNQQTGEWEDVPNFVDCIVFGNRATALADMWGVAAGILLLLFIALLGVSKDRDGK